MDTYFLRETFCLIISRFRLVSLERVLQSEFKRFVVITCDFQRMITRNACWKTVESSSWSWESLLPLNEWPMWPVWTKALLQAISSIPSMPSTATPHSRPGMLMWVEEFWNLSMKDYFRKGLTTIWLFRIRQNSRCIETALQRIGEIKARI